MEERQSPVQRAPRPQFGTKPFVYSLCAQGLLLLVAVSVAVIPPILQSEPDFVAKKTIYLPQREIEHRMAMAQFSQVAQPPVQLARITTESLLPNALPELPDLPVTTDSLRPSPALPMLTTSSLLGQSGLMAGFGEIPGETSEFEFFGIKDSATRIIICFDVSLSVKNKVEKAGLTMHEIRDETKEVLHGLNVNTLFGLIQFSRQYDLFRDYLVAATQENKEAALHWLESEFRTDGRSGYGWNSGTPNGIQCVIRAAFSLDPEPDMIIILSDGSFQRTPASGGSEDVPWDELANDIETFQDILPEKVRIHFIGFEMKDRDKGEMSRIVSRYRGRLREFN